MKKPQKPPTQAIPRIARGIVPTTAIASGLFSPASLGAPGDLDLTFGDMGRVDSGLALTGPAWSVQALAGGESFTAGGEDSFTLYGCYYEACVADGFIGQISASGSRDLSVTLGLLANTVVLDVALQSDGKLVAVGRTVSSVAHTASCVGSTVCSSESLTVFRLEPGGSLDATFAGGGVMQYTAGTAALSVTLDPGGSIVVAGTSGGAQASHAGQLMVLRLLENGRLDASFGNRGVYTGPAIDASTRTHILRSGSGGYRISTNLSGTPRGCAVLALTAAGSLDKTFGVSGIAALNPTSGASFTCQSMTTQSDGSLLLAGQASGQGSVSRLLASGNLDPSFAADPVIANMTEATSLAVDAAGSILVAGRPPTTVPGALIVHLQANGALDALFGNGGSTWIDLPSSEAAAPVIYDMNVLADGRILAAGGESPTSGKQRPLLVRLLGTGGSGGAGVIGVAASNVSVKQADGTAVVNVRRTGGAAGEVSVAYSTADYTGTDALPATSGTDYTPVTGRVTWTDGDRSDRHIAVPIIADSGQVAERFTVTLEDVQGGAEIGTQYAVVEIAGTQTSGAGGTTGSSGTSAGGGASGGGGTSGGGGAFDWLVLLCLSGIRWLRGHASVSR